MNQINSTQSDEFISFRIKSLCRLKKISGGYFKDILDTYDAILLDSFAYES